MPFFSDEIDELLDELRHHAHGSESRRILLTRIASKVKSLKDFDRVYYQFPKYPEPENITLLIHTIGVLNDRDDLDKLRPYVRSGAETGNALNNKIAQIS